MVGTIENFSGPFVEILLWASFSYKVHVVEVTPGSPGITIQLIAHEATPTPRLRDESQAS